MWLTAAQLIQNWRLLSNICKNSSKNMGFWLITDQELHWQKVFEAKGTQRLNVTINKFRLSAQPLNPIVLEIVNCWWALLNNHHTRISKVKKTIRVLLISRISTQCRKMPIALKKEMVHDSNYTIHGQLLQKNNPKTQTLIFPARRICKPNNWNLNCKAVFYHEPSLLQVRLSVYILYSKARARVSK